MPRLQRRRRSLDVAREPSRAQPRMLPARAYRDLGRRPPLLDLSVRRPPYLEAAVTAAVFIFLAYLVLVSGLPGAWRGVGTLVRPKQMAPRLLPRYCGRTAREFRV